MNKKLVITLLIFLVLFMGAQCGKNNTESTGPFLGGTDGIVIAFKSTAPTSSFQEDEEVPVAVNIKNEGEYDLKSGDVKIRLFGLTLENFNLQNAGKYLSLNSEIKGANKEFFPEGGEKELTMGKINYKLDIFDVPFTLRARVCYPYQTRGIIDVCMKSQLLQDIGEGVCSIDGEKVATGDISKGPVQITSIIEETRGRNQIKFNIKIENKGTGKVYNSKDSCQDLEDNAVKKIDSADKILIKINNPTNVKCGSDEKSETLITLTNNQYILTCWKDIEGVEQAKLDITLDYKYVSDIGKDITITKAM